MKAQINLFLKDDDTHRAITEGTAIELASLLIKMGGLSNENKLAIYIAASEMLNKDALPELAGSLIEEVMHQSSL